MNADVSVLIPSYNRAHVLPRALDSVLEQSTSPAEIIVIDDGSTDATAGLLSRDYPQIKIHRQSNQGVSAARNAGIRLASGRWIALLDSDDAWKPDKLEIQLQALAEQPGYRVAHTDEIWIRNGVRVNAMQKHRKRGGWIFQHCLPLCAISPSAALIRRDVFNELGEFDEALPACEDYDLWLRVCAREPVLFVGQPLTIKYGGHSDQLSRQFWGMDRFRIQALANLLEARDLGEADRRAALKVLHQKLAIYLQGARKRDKHDEVSRCLDLQQRFPLCSSATSPC